MIDIDDFLNQTFFAIDVRNMLGDVEDFILFSESNIEWQKKRELRRTEKECEKELFDDKNMQFQYTCQKLDSVEYRFDVSLTQSVRYSGITTLVTTIEWCLLSLQKRALFDIKNKQYYSNDALNALKAFSIKLDVNLNNRIAFIEKLIHIRNCIVHSAGLINSYKHSVELRKELKVISGVSITKENFLGDSIKVQSGFLEKTLKEVESWLPDIEKTAYDKKLLK